MSEELRGWVSTWRQNFQYPISNFQIRWIEPKNLHVTLVPPWQSQEWKVESEKLKVIKFRPFEIRFNKIALEPDERRPRMVWATGEAGEEIRKLKKLIEIALVDKTRTYALSKHQATQGFRLHVTLARLKDADESAPARARLDSTIESKRAERDGSARYNIELPQNIDWRQTVSSFVLYRSRLLPQGVDYEVLEEFKFGL